MLSDDLRDAHRHLRELTDALLRIASAHRSLDSDAVAALTIVVKQLSDTRVSLHELSRLVERREAAGRGD
jgi:hypothetical protein